MGQWSGLLGVAVIVALAWILSEDRSRVKLRIVLVGLGLQFLLAALLMGVPPVVSAYGVLADGFTKALLFAGEGSAFVFGGLARSDGPWGFVFAFQVLPVIVFFSAVMSVLFHLGVMQRVVGVLAWVLRRTLGVSGEEAVAAAANVFVGQTEAPLCIKMYLPRLTRSQLMLVMTGGFATIAGSVLAAVVLVLGQGDQALQSEFTRHLLTASAMSAPGAFVLAKLMVPDAGDAPSVDAAVQDEGRATSTVLDAVTVGAGEGLRLALNVAAMLIAFVAILALLDWPLELLSGTAAGRWFSGVLGLDSLSISGLLGVLFRPIAWFMGLTGSDAAEVGGLLGLSVFATEFVAYLELGALIESESISPRAAAVTAFALCGFANIPSIAIQIGGLSALAPSRRAEFVSLGPRAMVAGAMTCWMTGCIASLFIPVAAA